MPPGKPPPPDDGSTLALQPVMEIDQTCPDGSGQNGDNLTADAVNLLTKLASSPSTTSSLAHALSRLRHDLDEAFAHHHSEIQRCVTQALAESRNHPACCPKCAAAAGGGSSIVGGTKDSREGGVISPGAAHDSPERVAEQRRSGQQTMIKEKPSPDDGHNVYEGEETGASFPSLGGMPGTAAGDAGADPARPKAASGDVAPTSGQGAVNDQAHQVNGEQPAKADKKKPSAVKKSFEFEDSMKEYSDQGIRQSANYLLHDKRFELMVIFFIVANAITLGISVQYNSVNRKHSEDKSEPFIIGLEVIFLIFFTVELAVRLFVWRTDFFIGQEWSWNWFDAFVVVVSLADRLLEAVAHSQIPPQLSVLRVLRIVRVLRMLRIIRVMRFFRDLRLMVVSILGSVKSLCWVTVILFLMFYVFGVCLTQGATDYLSSNNNWDSADTKPLREWFGSLENSILSLLEAMIGGVSWGEHMDVLSQLPLIFPLIFLIFIIFSILAVLNIVTAVFVESAMDQAESAKDLVAQDKLDAKNKLVKELDKIFKTIDADQSGSISSKEMEEAMVNPEVTGLLGDADIDENDTRELFKVLDTGGEGSVDFNEFLEGFMKINGQATGLDFAAIKYQVKWLVKTSNHMSQQMEAVSEKLASKLVSPMAGNKEVPLIFV